MAGGRDALVAPRPNRGVVLRPCCWQRTVEARAADASPAFGGERAPAVQALGFHVTSPVSMSRLQFALSRLES